MKLVVKSAANMLLTAALLLLPTAFAQVHSSSANEDCALNSDLASVLQTSSIAQQETLSQALQIIHSIKSAPTCNRLAALTLINNCKSLEQSEDTEMALDEVNSEYAARLVVCELLGAKALILRECVKLVPPPRPVLKADLAPSCRDRRRIAQIESPAAQRLLMRCLSASEHAGVKVTLLDLVQQRTAEQISFAEKVRSSQDKALASLELNNETAVHSLNNISTSIELLQDDDEVASKSIGNLKETAVFLNNTFQHIGIATNIHSTVNATTESMGKFVNFSSASLDLWVAIAL